MTTRAWPGVAMIVALSLGCTTAVERGETPSSTGSSRSEPVIDHLVPARDARGKVPSRFEWTSIEGADVYEFAVMNEIDVVMWRQRNVPTNSIAMPSDFKLEPGTYFWMVAALRDDRAIAQSGRAAFMVME